MNKFASMVRVVGCVGFVVVLASACGGRGFNAEEEAGGNPATRAGSTGSAGRPGGSGAGGSGAGGSGAAGTASGGFGTAGTGAGGTASAGETFGGSGTGGSVPFDEACDAPPVVGPCKAAAARWYNDPSTGVCLPFTYGGCGGNMNNYDTLAACQKACPNDKPPQYDACQVASDCVVRGASCCGVCDGPGVTAHDLVAYNKKFPSPVACPVGLRGADAAFPAPPIVCDVCAPTPYRQGTLKYFVPDCVQGQCVVTDLRSSPLTACKSHDDCRVRHGSGCCESCNSDDVLAVRNDGSFEKLVCSGSPTPCPLCLPPIGDAVAFCGAGGRCELGYPFPPPPP